MLFRNIPSDMRGCGVGNMRKLFWPIHVQRGHESNGQWIGRFGNALTKGFHKVAHGSEILFQIH